MIKVLKLLCFFLFPLFALKAEIHLNQLSEKESSQKMFAFIYQGYLKPGRENEYQEAWSKVAQYFIEFRGAIGSCLHRTSDGLWVAYSRWPDKKTRDNSWPGENAPSEELPLEIRNAVLTIKDCLDSDRKIPDLCMEVVNDLPLSSDDAESSLALSPDQEKIMNLVYEEVEIAIQEGNPPFASIITDSENNILAIAHNQANTKQLAIAHAEIEAIQLACKILRKKKLDGCIIYANAESCAMCSTAIIKSGISQVFYGAPHEKGSNPDVHLLEINKKTTPQLKVHGGFMKDKFIKQIKRGRNQ
jgi:tRNA(Arg) A34 adenosine deaminase TadA